MPKLCWSSMSIRSKKVSTSSRSGQISPAAPDEPLAQHRSANPHVAQFPVQHGNRPLRNLAARRDPFAELVVVRVRVRPLQEILLGDVEGVENAVVEGGDVAVAVLAGLARLDGTGLVGHARGPGDAGDAAQIGGARRPGGQVHVAEGAPVVELYRLEHRGDVGVPRGVPGDPLDEQALVQLVLRRLLQAEAVELVDLPGAAACGLQNQLSEGGVVELDGPLDEIVRGHPHELEDVPVESGVAAVLVLPEQLLPGGARLVRHAGGPDDSGHAEVGGPPRRLFGKVHFPVLLCRRLLGKAKKRGAARSDKGTPCPREVARRGGRGVPFEPSAAAAATTRRHCHTWRIRGNQ